MSQEPDWQDTELEDDQIYSDEALKRFWLKYEDPILFLQSISHELREQMIPIQSFFQLLRDEKRKHIILENLEYWLTVVDSRQEKQLEIIRIINKYFEHKLDKPNNPKESE